jgi:dolichol kinase
MLLVIFLIPSLFIILIGLRKKYFTNKSISTIILALPWLLGIVPGVIFYTETRFKIVSELLLVPFIALVLTSVKFKQQTVETTEIFVSDKNKA